ncbi:MAG: LiaI-LiaF-like domain-containing protein [Candidatus Aminicenantaceae bacterium]
MAKYKRREPLAWGIILIAIGLIFLFVNIDVDIWGFIAKLWPVILILWGAWKLYFGIKESQKKLEPEKE